MFIYIIVQQFSQNLWLLTLQSLYNAYDIKI